MDYEANPYHDQLGPAPAPGAQPPRWKVPRVAVTVGLAAFLGMAGAGVAFAVGGPSGSATASSGSSSSSSSGSGSTGNAPGAQTPAHPGPLGRHPGFGPMDGRMGGPGGAVLHGIFTVKNGTGYKVEQIQVGSVQSGNTATSITVKSADGYPQTYAVTSSTEVNSQAGGISTVQPGDQVRVESVKQSNGSYTATDIVDMTRIRSSRSSFGFAPPAPPAGQQAQPGSAA